MIAAKPLALAMEFNLQILSGGIFRQSKQKCSGGSTVKMRHVVCNQRCLPADQN